MPPRTPRSARQPTAAYMTFVQSVAKKILDPKTVLKPDPKNPKCVAIKAPRKA